MNVTARRHVRPPERSCTSRGIVAGTHARISFWTTILALWLAAVALPNAALAQQRFNFLAVDETIVDDAGPYYFVAQGDSTNAFVKAGPIAAAMNLTVALDDSGDALIFRQGTKVARWQVARDVAYGLRKRSNVLDVDGTPFPRDIPSAILVAGTSYVPVTPLAEAFGGTATWLPEARVIRVTIPEPNPTTEEGQALASVVAAETATGGTPRIGQHDGFTRVAIDAAAGQTARLLVADGTVALALPNLGLDPLDRSFDAGYLKRVYADTIAGSPALVLLVDHTVSTTGDGFRMGRTESGTIYVDVGPDLRGEATAALDFVDAGVPVAAAPPVQRTQVVVLDAGHGGHDPGTVSAWAQEKEIVLDVALRVAERLREHGIHVILTRDDDTFLTLQDRSTYATTERNLFVSIHANAAPNVSASGIETWVFGQPLDPTLIDRAIRENGGGEVGEALTAEAAQVADIAGDILRETQLNYSLNLANLVQTELVEATGAIDRGVRQNLFYVIRNSRIPAVLIELGFVSHADEGRRLMQDAYRSTLADAIASGLLGFLDAGGEQPDIAQR